MAPKDQTSAELIAAHPRKAEILKALQEGKKTIKQASQELGVEYHELWKYLKRQESASTKLAIDTLDEKIRVLSEILEKVKENVHRVLNSAHTGEGLRYGPNWIRELRNLLTDMAKFQSQIVESPMILVQNVVNVQTEMQTFLLQNLCPKCKKKFIEFLEAHR